MFVSSGIFEMLNMINQAPVELKEDLLDSCLSSVNSIKVKLESFISNPALCDIDNLVLLDIMFQLDVIDNNMLGSYINNYK